MYLTPPHIYSWTPSHCKSKYRYDMVLILQLWSCKICPCILNARIFEIFLSFKTTLLILNPVLFFYDPLFHTLKILNLKKGTCCLFTKLRINHTFSAECMTILSFVIKQKIPSQRLRSFSLVLALI